MTHPTITEDLKISIKKINEFIQKELENYSMIQGAAAFEALGKTSLSFTIYFLKTIYGENSAKAHAQCVTEYLITLFDDIINESYMVKEKQKDD